jgi:hypothetical protein
MTVVPNWEVLLVQVSAGATPMLSISAVAVMRLVCVVPDVPNDDAVPLIVMLEVPPTFVTRYA